MNRNQSKKGIEFVMNKILINNALKNQTQFSINNQEDINGRLKFISIVKKSLSNYKLDSDYPKEFLDNPIIDLIIEFTNLNHNEISTYEFKKSTLIDLDNFEFKPIAIDNGFSTNEQDNEIFKIFSINKENFSNDRVYPKIKKQIHLFFLVPNEDTEYYFGMQNSIIEEI